LCASAIKLWCEGRRSLLPHSTVKPAGSLSVTPMVTRRQTTAKFITLCHWLKLNNQRERRYKISPFYVPIATASSTCGIHRIRLRNSKKCSHMHTVNGRGHRLLSILARRDAHVLPALRVDVAVHQSYAAEYILASARDIGRRPQGATGHAHLCRVEGAMDRHQ